jgi:protein-tyrosine phosphatase
VAVAVVPPPETGRATYSIATVCLGNICRSPMAAVVLEARLAAAGLADRVAVESSGTGDWHVGEPMDRRAAATLAAHGHDPSRHRARLFRADWFDRHDLLLAMDRSNLRDIRAMASDPRVAARTLLFRHFDPVADSDLDVPDPWYGGQDGFDLVMSIVTRTSDEIVRQLHAMLAAPPN